MAREDPQLKLRLTEEMKELITEAARVNNRSVNAEIVSRLQATEAGGIFFTMLEQDLAATKGKLQHVERQLRNRSMDDLGRNLQLGLPPALFGRLEQAAASRGRSLEQELIAALEIAYPPPPPFSLDAFRSEWLERIWAAEGEAREKLIDEANEVLQQHGGFFQIWHAKPMGRNDPGEVVMSMISREDRE